jgi:hypothetical protein
MENQNGIYLFKIPHGSPLEEAWGFQVEGIAWMELVLYNRGMYPDHGNRRVRACRCSNVGAGGGNNNIAVPGAADVHPCNAGSGLPGIMGVPAGI